MRPLGDLSPHKAAALFPSSQIFLNANTENSPAKEANRNSNSPLHHIKNLYQSVRNSVRPASQVRQSGFSSSYAALRVRRKRG